MKKTALYFLLQFKKITPFLISLVLFLFFLILQKNPVQSALAGHLVISEVKTAGVNASDEFIELYNPTSLDINLIGWRLTRIPQDGDPESSLIASMSGTIPAHGFFLLANDESPASGSADLVYASSLASNSTISLYSDAAITRVDRVGLGTATIFESSAAAQPVSGKSIERKANSSSTSDSMSSGIDQTIGNGEDSDNNSNDFILRDTPEPQNSLSSIEPPLAPTPTPISTPSPTPSSTPSPTQSPSPTPSSTPEPTASPTPSPSPTIEPSPTVSPTQTPTPTSGPTATPTASPTPTSTPTPTSSPTPSPTSTPSPFPSLRVSCSVTQIQIDFGFIKFSIPRISCRLIRG